MTLAPNPSRTRNASVMPSRYYEYRHIIGFEETNLVGNVYFVNHLRWQGRCREMFLRDHAPGILRDISTGLALVTTRVNCEFFAEASACEEISIRMRLAGITQNRITMTFEYWKVTKSTPELIARGQQEIACMRRNSTDGGALSAIEIPKELLAALRPYASSDIPNVAETGSQEG